MMRPIPDLRGRFAAKLRGLLALALLPAMGLAFGQVINDTPMAVKNNVAPNFMFMLDNSGSMKNIVPEAPYDPATNYTPAGCPAASVLGNGTSIDLRIAGGAPFIRVGASNFRHWTLGGGPADLRCFDRARIYGARLLADNAGSPSVYLDADYDGNFLNWYFGTAGGHPSTGWGNRKALSAGAVRTRMEIAQTSADSVISSLPIGALDPVVRVGLSTYNIGNGGALRVGIADFTAAHLLTLKASIAGLSPSGNTPLAETLADIGRYMATGYSGNITAGSVTGVTIDDFLKQDGRQSCLNGANCLTGTTDPNAAPATGTPLRPIQYWCQRSYAFLMTDGRPQGDQAFTNNVYLRDYDGDCSGANAANCAAGNPNWDRKTARTYESAGSDYLDDIAMALFDVDLRPNLPAPPGRTKRNNLRTYTIGFADLQVQNDPLLINTAKQGGGLFRVAKDGASLTTEFRSIVAEAFAKDAAAAAVAVVNAQITLNNIGYASSYRSASWYGDLVAYSLNTSTGLPIEPPIWSVRANIEAQAPATRKIASFNGASGTPFTAANFAGTPPSLTAGVINYLRGDRSGEGTTYRQRQYVMGDVINAEPLVVSYPGGVPIVFPGANDGMLHVVDGRTDASAATRGQELWAYVPRLVHGSLANLADPSYAHRYYVDGTPAAAEVTGLPFTRILVGGLGKGGRGFYALNISNYSATDETDAASKVLWEFTNANMGYSFGTPQIVKTASGWRVVVTSGYDNGTASGGDGQGYVWVLDPSNGNVLATLATGVGAAANPSGLAHLSRIANSAPDAIVRFLWGGDLYGNVWRFDLDTNSVARVATLTDVAGVAQPVTSPPEVTTVSGSATKFMVTLGTGRYLADEDVPGAGANIWATQRQSLYGLIDDTSVAAPPLPNLRGANGPNCPAGGGAADLVCQGMTFNAGTSTYQSTSHTVNPATRRGWYVDLPVDANLSNGRIVGKPALTGGGTLVVSANVPTSTKCDPGGSSWLLMLNVNTGGAVAVEVGGATFYDSGYFLGYALASSPVIVQTADGKRALMRMYDTTFRSVRVRESTLTVAPWRRIYWRPVN